MLRVNWYANSCRERTIGLLLNRVEQARSNSSCRRVYKLKQTQQKANIARFPVCRIGEWEVRVRAARLQKRSVAMKKQKNTGRTCD